MNVIGIVGIRQVEFRFGGEMTRINIENVENVMFVGSAIIFRTFFPITFESGNLSSQFFFNNWDVIQISIQLLNIYFFC